MANICPFTKTCYQNLSDEQNL